MAETFSFELLKPDGLVLSVDDAVEVVIPGADGYFGVLKDHHPLLAILGVGVLSLRTPERRYEAMVADGFCEVAHNRVVVLAETAERAEEIDVGRARRSLERARERIARGGQAEELETAWAAVGRAESRLKAAASL